MPNIYWLAIDKNNEFCSYEELKERQVVAQGWPAFGDISNLIQLVIKNNESVFVREIQQLGDRVYPKSDIWRDTKRNPSSVPRIFWTLFNLKAGDLVVALEGTKVKGICQLKTHAINSYKYQKDFDYAHGFGYPVDWLDWDSGSAIQPPISPKQSVAGIARMRNEEEYVLTHWQQVTNIKLFSYPEELNPEIEYFEGTKYTVEVNAYERSSEAREACLKKYGFDCMVCGFNFGKVYGAKADRYIHVHHLKPISQIGINYKVNPDTDLVPVCPNCHAVIHLSKEPLSINDVKKLLNRL